MDQLSALKSALCALARALDELQDIETPPLQLTDEMNSEQGDRKRIQTTQDEAFWTAWRTICDDILPELEIGEPTLTSTMYTDTPAYLRYEAAAVPNSSTKDTPIALSVRYYATGDLIVNAEYSFSPEESSMREFYKGTIEEYDTILAGEYIASISLTALVLHDLSAPEALDYWQTQVDDKYTQRQWSKVRKVTDQAISDNVTKAQSKLDDGK